MNENAKQWLEGALMDLCSIEKIMDDAYLTPVVCFHSQQCVEKTLKAVLEDCGCDVPKTHDLVRLYGLIPNYINLLMDSDLLHAISDLYIETRYPGEFGLMPDGKPTLEDVKVFYEFAKDVHGTIQTILSQR